MIRSITPVARPEIDTEMIGFVYDPGGKRIMVTVYQGYKDETGHFVDVSRQAISISGADYEALIAANDRGKRTGQFRTDDVLAMVDAIRGRG